MKWLVILVLVGLALSDPNDFTKGKPNCHWWNIQDGPTQEAYVKQFERNPAEISNLCKLHENADSTIEDLAKGRPKYVPADPQIKWPEWLGWKFQAYQPEGKFTILHNGYIYTAKCVDQVELAEVGVKDTKKLTRSTCINGGAIIDHESPDKRRFVAVQK